MALYARRLRIRVRPALLLAAVLSLSAFILVGRPGIAAAQAPAATEPTVLERSLYKTLVFEGTTNLIDLALFGSVLGGHIAGGPAFVAVNASAAVLMYYGHEVAWGYLGPPNEAYDVEMNILKGLTFRLASSTRAFAIGYGFTGNPIAATGFMVGSAVGETVVYIANEYGWAFYDQLRTPVATVTATPAALVGTVRAWWPAAARIS